MRINGANVDLYAMRGLVQHGQPKCTTKCGAEST